MAEKEPKTGAGATTPASAPPKPKGPEEFNPPKGWAPPEPPTAEDEEEVLAKEFGEPVNGVYAPYVGGVEA